MRSDGHKSGPICFGVFEADLAGRTLRKSGVRVRLQEKPFRVLAMLLAKPGEVVTREELKAELWPNDEYGEFDLGLNTAVKKVRAALGDSAATPKWVETIPKVGYRFLGQIDGQEKPVPPRASRRLKPSAVAAISLGVIGAGGLLVTSWTDSSAPVLNPQDLIEVPLTRYTGEEAHPSFSADGSRVAYSRRSSRDDDWDIYLEVVGGAQAQRPLVESSDDELFPTLSPDGTRIAFWRVNEKGEAAIVVASALGGDERRVHSRDERLSDPGREYFRGSLSWSPDNSRIAFAARDGLALLTVADGQIDWLTMPPAEGSGDIQPTFSPDGRTVTFVRRAGSNAGHNIYALDLSEDYVPTGEPRQVTAFDWQARTPAWTPDGEQILFSGKEEPGQEGLWSVPASGGAPELIWRQSDVDGNSCLAVSRTSYGGVQIGYAVREEQTSDIYEIDLSGPKAGTPRKLIATTERDSVAQYSPDGDRIAYYSGWPERDIYVAEADGSRPRRLTFHNHRQAGPFSWSPDGKQIAYFAGWDPFAHLFAVSTSGGRSRQLTAGKADEVFPSWSPDGQWIYFSSKRSGESAIWKIPAEGGPAQQVVQGGYRLPRVSADGQTLLLATRDKSLYQVPLDRSAAPEELGLTIPGFGRPFHAESGIFYTNQGGISTGPLYRFEPRHARI